VGRLAYPLRKLLHGLPNLFGTGLAVRPLSGAQVTVAQDLLDYVVRNTQLREVGSQATTKGMPAVPVETSLLQPSHDVAAEEVVEIHRQLAALVGKQPTLPRLTAGLPVLVEDSPLAAR